jgi:hypothetical protein
MRLFSYYGRCRRRCFTAAIGLSLPLSFASGQQLDTARALSALRDARTACESDAGVLWGRTLCGPIALVDRQTRLVIANDTVPQTHFLRLGDAYVMTLPENQYVANTSFPWAGRTWTMVALPLPRDRFARIGLVMHEVFHREQEALGLRQPDALNNQLDMRPGRTWLRLEYRALSRALESLPDKNAARHDAESALIFRAKRRSIYPGSDSLEATLEIQEGLPEYTGQRLAMQLTGEGPARVAKFVRDYESTPTFVRAFAYGTGPAIGVLLDQFDPAWREEVRKNRDMGALLAQAIHFQRPRDLDQTARARARDYGWGEVDRSEAVRDSARAPTMQGYRARLGAGPVVTLLQSKDSPGATIQRSLSASISNPLCIHRAISRRRGENSPSIMAECSSKTTSRGSGSAYRRRRSRRSRERSREMAGRSHSIRVGRSDPTHHGLGASSRGRTSQP